jgi:hypothetical protein
VRAVRAYGVVVWLHSSCTWKIHGDEWPASPFGLLNTLPVEQEVGAGGGQGQWAEKRDSAGKLTASIGSIDRCLVHRTDRAIPITLKHELGVVSTRPRRFEMSAVEPVFSIPSTV